jgi:hypothetical protein
VGGIAGLAVLIAPMTYNGLLLMVGSVIVGLICFAGYMWSEPDEVPSSSGEPPEK